MPSKIDLRRHFRRQRQSLTPAARQRAEKRINNLLKGYLKRGKRLAIYWPIGSELRLDSLAAAARQRGTELYLPYIPNLPAAKSASTTCIASSSP